MRILSSSSWRTFREKGRRKQRGKRRKEKLLVNKQPSWRRVKCFGCHRHADSFKDCAADGRRGVRRQGEGMGARIVKDRKVRSKKSVRSRTEEPTHSQPQARAMLFLTRPAYSVSEVSKSTAPCARGYGCVSRPRWDERTDAGATPAMLRAAKMHPATRFTRDKALRALTTGLF